ncbi:TetR/AcrR family transcriptional regulator [Thermobifida cellulosilytica]|uniref:TetR family transcriptional regulator n=1 Tax=Thermobifida cellulosilytica TB100 TaxID=665004 RepID=A0A147KKH2_THECS|nr:TetR family transcriptional regulator C-terminal domain-containing protein [Thermobifida cellulosilytica]KUP97796.1 TetR family transcriptional regulator [Thermobifida cellulosilytica TB100]
MKRAEVIAEAAVALLAERGMRGLTHRAVDEAAGLPPGSTSNLARTRAALLELALEHLTEQEAALFAPMTAAGPPRGAEELVELMARLAHLQLTEGRERTVARYELALEATRRPELRAIYDRAGQRFREAAVAVLAAAGSPDPLRHGHRLVAFAEGLMFDAIVGAGSEPTLDELRTCLRELLDGMLGRPDAADRPR